MRYVLAGALSLPVAALFAINGALMVAWGDARVPVMAVAAAVSWAIVTYLGAQARSPKQLFGRAAAAAAVAGFALPLSMFIGVASTDVLAAHRGDVVVDEIIALVGTGTIEAALVGAAAVIGVIVGGLSGVAALVALRNPYG